MENHQEWLGISVLVLFVGLYSYFDSWVFRTNPGLVKIETQKVAVSEPIKIEIFSEGKHKNIMAFTSKGKRFVAACVRMQIYSQEYNKICNYNGGNTIYGNNIEFLDIYSPTLNGVFLKGHFYIGNEVIYLNLNEHHYGVESYKRYNFIFLIIRYLMIVLPIIYIFYVLCVLIFSKRN